MKHWKFPLDFLTNEQTTMKRILLIMTLASGLSAVSQQVKPTDTLRPQQDSLKVKVVSSDSKEEKNRNVMLNAANNTMDLSTIIDTRTMMKDKPVIVSVTATKPMIFSEFEKIADGIVVNFGV